MDWIGGLCQGCQAQLGPGQRFCSACGRPAARSQSATVPAAPPVSPPLAAGPPPAARAPAQMPTRSDWILPAAPQPGQPPAWPADGPPTTDQPGFVPYRGPAQPFGGPPPGPPRQPPRRHNGNRARSSRFLWVLLALLLVAVAAVLLARPFSHQASQAASAGTTPSASGAASPGPASASPSAAPPATLRQAAASVAGLLTQSVSDRAAVSSAAADISGCGPHLAADQQVFTAAVRSRQSLLASLSALPGRDTLPAPLVSDLTAAWQASIAADQAYARWASDEIAKGCTVGDTGDPGYQAAQGPDAAATRDKTAFTTAWDPVAARYGLTSYQPGQL